MESVKKELEDLYEEVKENEEYGVALDILSTISRMEEKEKKS